MNLWNEFHGPNAGYVVELYERYRRDPQSVDAATRALFERWTPPEAPAAGNGAKAIGPTAPVGAAGSIGYDYEEESERVMLRVPPGRLIGATLTGSFSNRKISAANWSTLRQANPPYSRTKPACAIMCFIEAQRGVALVGSSLRHW